MTRDHDVSGGDITTVEEFDEAIGELLSAVTELGVDPQGTRVYRNGGNAPDWEVMILELDEDSATG